MLEGLPTGISAHRLESSNAVRCLPVLVLESLSGFGRHCGIRLRASGGERMAAGARGHGLSRPRRPYRPPPVTEFSAPRSRDRRGVALGTAVGYNIANVGPAAEVVSHA